MAALRLLRSSIRRPGAARLISLAAFTIVVALVVALVTVRSAPAKQKVTLDSAGGTCSVQLVTPAYFYPGASWQELLANPIPHQVVIVNPSSGPGNGPNPAYQSVIQQAAQQGDTLLGYINTFYTGSSLASVESQIHDYASWYGITNIFLDDMSSASSNFGYYQALSNAVHQATPSATVMLNPGTYPAAVYGTLGDPLVVYEGPYGQFASTTPPAWTASYPSTQFAVMVSAVPSGQLATMLSVAAAHRDHFVYATDDATTSTLYESLPSYWPTEVTSVSSECGSAPASTSESTPPTSSSGSSTPPNSSGGSSSSTGSGTASSSSPSPRTVTLPTSTGSSPSTVPSTSTPGNSGKSGNSAPGWSGGLGFSGHPGGAASASAATRSYRVVSSDGAVTGSAGTALFGSEAGQPLNAPIVGLASTPGNKGYWLAARDGGVFAFGNARFAGSMGGFHLNAPIVGMAPDPATGGYWLVASDGGIFSFNAPFFGSMGGTHLNAPVVGIAVTPGGGGYWLVARDGGVFAFGNARFAGSMGGFHLNAPIVGMAPDPATGGYWLVASDGGIFSLDAPFFGSKGGQPLTAPIVGMTASTGGNGYGLLSADGSVSGFGSLAMNGIAPGWIPSGSTAVAIGG